MSSRQHFSRWPPPKVQHLARAVSNLCMQIGSPLAYFAHIMHFAHFVLYAVQFVPYAHQTGRWVSALPYVARMHFAHCTEFAYFALLHTLQFGHIVQAHKFVHSHTLKIMQPSASCRHVHTCIICTLCSVYSLYTTLCRLCAYFVHADTSSCDRHP